MEDFIKVKDRDKLVRDRTSNAIVNLDFDDYQSYVENYNRVLSEKQRIQKLESDVANIQNDLSEIKDLLRSLKQ
jgi:hypothetical protein